MSLLKSINLGLDQNGNLMELPEFIQCELGNTMEDVRNFMVEFINVQFLMLKKNIAGHKMYVMNEDILYCNPKTDHLEPKNVLPVFEPFVDEAYNAIISMNWTAIYHRIYSTITQLSLLLNEENINLEDKNIDLTYDNAVLEEKYKAIQQQLQNKIHYGMDLIFRRAQQLKGESVSQMPGFQYQADDFVKSKRAGRGQIDQLLKMNTDLTTNMSKLQNKYDELKKQYDKIQQSSQLQIQELTKKIQFMEATVKQTENVSSAQNTSAVINQVIGTMNKLQQITLNTNNRHILTDMKNQEQLNDNLVSQLSMIEQTIQQYANELDGNNFENIYLNTKNKNPDIIQQSKTTVNNQLISGTAPRESSGGAQSGALGSNDIQFIYQKDMNINQAIQKLKREFKGRALANGEYDKFPELDISTDSKNMQKYQKMDKDQLIKELAKMNQLYAKSSQENSQLQSQLAKSGGIGAGKGGTLQSGQGSSEININGKPGANFTNSIGDSSQINKTTGATVEQSKGVSKVSGQRSGQNSTRDGQYDQYRSSSYTSGGKQFQDELGNDLENKYITDGDDVYYIDSSGNKVKIDKNSAEYAQYKQIQQNKLNVAGKLAKNGLGAVAGDIISQYDEEGNLIPAGQRHGKVSAESAQNGENGMFDEKDLELKANNLEGLEKLFKDMFGIDINKIGSIAELKKLIREKMNSDVSAGNQALEDMININIEHEGEVAILDKAMEIFLSYYSKTRTIATQVSFNGSSDQLEGDAAVVPNIENLSKAITKTNHFLRVNNQYFQVPGYCVDSQSVIDKINMQKRKANRNMTRKLDNTTKGYLNRTKTLGHGAPGTPGLSQGHASSPGQSPPQNFTQQQLMKIRSFQMNESAESKKFIQELLHVIQEQQILLEEAKKLLESSNQNGKPECINLINRINDCGIRANQMLQNNLYSDYLSDESRQKLRTPISQLDTQLGRIPTQQFNDRYNIINLNQIQAGVKQKILNDYPTQNQEYIPQLYQKKLYSSIVNPAQALQNKIGTNNTLTDSQLSVSQMGKNVPTFNINQQQGQLNQHVPEAIARQVIAQKQAEKRSAFLISSPKQDNVPITSRQISSQMDQSLTQSQLQIPNKSHTSYQPKRGQSLSKMVDQQTLQNLFAIPLSKNDALKMHSNKQQGTDRLIFQQLFSKPNKNGNNAEQANGVSLLQQQNQNKGSDMQHNQQQNYQNQQQQLSLQQLQLQSNYSEYQQGIKQNSTTSQEKQSQQSQQQLNNQSNQIQSYLNQSTTQGQTYQSAVPKNKQNHHQNKKDNQEIQNADLVPTVLPKTTEKLYQSSQQSIIMQQNKQKGDQVTKDNPLSLVADSQDLTQTDLSSSTLPSLSKYAGFGQNRSKIESHTQFQTTQDSGLVVIAFGTNEQSLPQGHQLSVQNSFTQFQGMSPSRIINYDENVSQQNIIENEPQLYMTESQAKDKK